MTLTAHYPIYIQENTGYILCAGARIPSTSPSPPTSYSAELYFSEYYLTWKEHHITLIPNKRWNKVINYSYFLEERLISFL